MIGDVEVRVVRVRKNEVRLGIVAPHDVPIYRKETYEAMARENEAAGTSSGRVALKLAKLARALRDTAGKDPKADTDPKP